MYGDSMSARSLVGRLSLACFQWQKLLILLFVGSALVLAGDALCGGNLFLEVLSAFATLQLLPEQELPQSFKRLRCQRCIVVGNGYSIRGQHFGKKIDSHAVIIRLNDAPVKKHKKDVGERTSIRLFFPESALPNPLENNDKETLMVFVPFKPLDFTWLRETKVGFWHQPPWEWNGNVSHLRILNLYVIYEATYKLVKLKIWSMARDRHLMLGLEVRHHMKTSSREYTLKRHVEKIETCIDSIMDRYATMGIIALNLAPHMCQEVNIAGLGYPGNHDNATPIHYYNTGLSLGKELFQHVTAERKWLLKMIRQGVIADIGKPSFQGQNR